jgi:hypothetical protein
MSKNVLSSLLGLSLFFNKTSDKGRTGPAWNGGRKEGEVGGGGQWGEMTQTMYAHVNKRIIIIKNQVEGLRAEADQ